MSDVARIDSSISFYQSKLSNAKFSILYDITLVRLKEKIEVDHCKLESASFTIMRSS